jgi:class 3 adenylate cyclase
VSKKEDEKTDAHDALDVGIDASTRTIRAQFRRKAKALQSGRAAGAAVSKKNFEELNEAYQTLIHARQKGLAAPTKTVTILSSDVAGYSKMMAENEQETLEFFHFCKEVFEEIVENNQGRVFNTAGDAILAEFDHVFNAVHCAVEIQKELRAVNLGQPEERRIQFRMGLNMGEVFLQEGDILGDTVNIAARIQTAAKPGGICLSGKIYDLISNKVSHSFTSLGKLTFKNIPEPVRTYALTEDDGKFKPPLPDVKITAFEAPKLSPKSRKASTAGSENGLRNVLLLSVAISAAAAFYFWKSSKAEPSAHTILASPNLSAAPAPNGPGHVFIAVTPDSNVSLKLGDHPAFSGITPAELDMAPGTYDVLIENKESGITEADSLLVESGKNARYLKDITDKIPVAAASGQIDFASRNGDSQPTQEEMDLRKRVDASNDPETEFEYAKSFLDKRDYETAYIYLTKSAIKGHGFAQFELGKLFYADHLRGKRNFDAAAYWLFKAALNGRTSATEFLANHRFPQEFAEYITDQRHVDIGGAKETLKRAKIQGYVDGPLKVAVQGQNLPI